MAKLLTAMRVVGEGQQGHRRGEDEGAADDRLLLVRRLALDPAEEQRNADSGAERGPLAHHPGRILEPQTENDDGQPDNLGSGQVDEHDASLQDLDPEGRMDDGDDQSDNEGGRHDAEQIRIDCGLPPATSA